MFNYIRTGENNSKYTFSQMNKRIEGVLATNVEEVALRLKYEKY